MRGVTLSSPPWVCILSGKGVGSRFLCVSSICKGCFYSLGGGFFVFVCMGKGGSVVCSLAGDLLVCLGVWEDGLWVYPRGRDCFILAWGRIWG